MAITVLKKPEYVFGSMLFTDDKINNVFSLRSTNELVRTSFRWNVRISVTRHITDGTVETYILDERDYQHGDINLYATLSTLNINEVVQIGNLSENPADWDDGTYGTRSYRDILTVVVREQWLNDGEIVSGSNETFTYFFQKGTQFGIDADLFQIASSYPPYISFVNRVNPNSKVPFQQFRQMTPNTEPGSSNHSKVLFGGNYVFSPGHGAFGINSGVQGIAVFTDKGQQLRLYYSSGASQNISGTINELGVKRYISSSCVENNVITWRDSSGFLNSFNFGHSSEFSGDIKRFGYSNKTAISTLQPSVSVTTEYISEEVQMWLYGILNSSEVYYNLQEVTPIPNSFMCKKKRFEELINVTIDFNFVQKENSILL